MRDDGGLLGQFQLDQHVFLAGEVEVERAARHGQRLRRSSQRRCPPIRIGRFRHRGVEQPRPGLQSLGSRVAKTDMA